MKIQCDVCDKGEASVFCIADEAALCNSCDHRVHHANKLASKHQRFSLLQPPPKQAPVCDICQERRAFLFCQQDRAILCRECDIPIHKANEHTEKHNRFLLTGVKLSANSALYSSPSEAAISANNSLTNSSDAVPTFNPQKNTVINKPVSINPTNISQNNPNPRTNINAKATTTTSAVANSVTAAAAPSPAPAVTNEKVFSINDQMKKGVDDNNTSPTSSIAEYLIEMLPGWHVEDFLDSSSPSGFCKSSSDGDVIPFWDDSPHNNLSPFLPENTGFWVPWAPAPVHVHPATQTQWLSNSSNVGFSFGGQIGFKDMIPNIKSSSRKWNEDNSFAVPQISPPFSVSSKRLRATTTSVMVESAESSLDHFHRSFTFFFSLSMVSIPLSCFCIF